MPYFDRFDICEAHFCLEMDYNRSGWLQERPSNLRRMEATSIQLERIGLKPFPFLGGYESLTDNGKEIYVELVDRWNLPVG